MGEISHACIVYKDDIKHFVTVPCSDIRLKRNSLNPIKPQNDRDFVRKQYYYVKWRNCGAVCEKDHEHVDGYYAALILLLGESEEDIQTKMKEGRRLIIPVIKDSSESEELVDLSRKVKHSTSAAQNALGQKNIDILKKFDAGKLLLASRKPMVSNDSDGDEATVEDSNRYREVVDQANHKNLEEQTREEKIQELQNRILELQQLPHCSHRSPKSTGDVSAGVDFANADVQGIRRNLFGGDADKPDENMEIQSESQDAGGRSMNERRSSRLTIRSIERINTNIIPKNKLERSKSSSSDYRKAQERFQPKKILNERDDQGGTSSIAGRSPESTSEIINNIRSNVDESIKCVVKDQARNFGEERQESSASDDEFNTRKDDILDEIGSNEKCRLEPTVKRRKIDDDNVNRRVNKKVVRDIETALQYYNDETDENGRKRYDVRDNKIYLGEGIEVSVTIWFMLQRKKPEIFFHDLVLVLWGERKLVNRCQNLAKVTTKLRDRSPMKELTPKKKRLAYKLYNDYLDKKKVHIEKKMEYLMDVPQLLTYKINNLRQKYYR